MKQKMKRVLLLLCMFACFFTLSACGKAQEDVEEPIDPQIISMLEDNGNNQLKAFASLTPEGIEQYTEQFEQQDNQVMVTALQNWSSTKDDLGGLVSIDSVKVEEADNEYVVTVHATFEKHPLVFIMNNSMKDGSVTGITFSTVYTMKEKLEQAFMNMIMGMGTVFLVLIFISIIIGCFKYINAWEKKMQQKKEGKAGAAAFGGGKAAPMPASALSETPAPAQIPAPAAAPAPASVPVYEESAPAEETETEYEDDLELAAVIAAAIAAAQSIPVEGLVVRSIKRKSASKWKNA